MKVGRCHNCGGDLRRKSGHYGQSGSRNYTQCMICRYNYCFHCVTINGLICSKCFNELSKTNREHLISLKNKLNKKRKIGYIVALISSFLLFISLIFLNIDIDRTLLFF